MPKKLQQTAALLLDQRTQNEGFWFRLFRNRPTSLADANVFFLFAILNYQIPQGRAEENAQWFAEEIVGSAERIWAFIAALSQTKWNERRQLYSLHRFPAGHERVWRIAKDILRDYDGDPRKIWKNQCPDEVLTRLNNLRVGEQISRMIVGALIDTGKIIGRGDVKPDIHVRRVLGRVFRGTGYTLSEVTQALELTRELSPVNPWLVDQPLYVVGQNNCHPTEPKCDTCYLSKVCTYSNNN